MTKTSAKPCQSVLKPCPTPDCQGYLCDPVIQKKSPKDMS